MKIALFGATGMVGQGVLRECLRDPGVAGVVSIVRRSAGAPHAKLREIVHGEFTDFSAIASELTGLDACFFCLGVSSAGMGEAEYTRVTYDIAIAAASLLARQNPGMTFVYVSGAGTDSTEQGRSMWGRVKGRTENALLAMPFKAAYMFRPAIIEPLHGITSKTRLYRSLYTAFGPLLPLSRKLFPGYMTTTEAVGLAMLEVARNGADKRVLDTPDINRLAAAAAAREQSRL